MSRAILKEDVLKDFNKAINLNRNLNNLDNDFEYLVSTFPFPVHDADWRPPAIINISQ